MANRKVKCTTKNSDGDITGLGNNDAPEWNHVSSETAIREIEGGIHAYYVKNSKGRSNVEVVNSDNGKYLRTDPNGKCSDNLSSLPSC